jgi:hypothetical protein
MDHHPQITRELFMSSAAISGKTPFFARNPERVMAKENLKPWFMHSLCNGER